MSLSFSRPIAVDPIAGVFMFADRPLPVLAGFDVRVLDVVPCPVQWHAETLVQRRARLVEARRRRRERLGHGA